MILSEYYLAPETHLEYVRDAFVATYGKHFGGNREAMAGKVQSGKKMARHPYIIVEAWFVAVSSRFVL